MTQVTDSSLYGVLCGFSLEPRENLSEKDVRRLDSLTRLNLH